MELLYLYIKRFRKVQNSEFCFSNQFNIKYVENDNKILFEDKKNPIPSGFYGEQISNVSVLIGENGSGKTETLNFIRNYLTNTKSASIVILGDSSEFPVKIFAFYHHTLDKIDIFPKNSPQFQVQEIKEMGTGINDPLDYILGHNIKIAYLNFGLQLRNEHGSAHTINLSTTNLLENSSEIRAKGRALRQTDAFRLDELRGIAKYLTSPHFYSYPFIAGQRLKFIGISVDTDRVLGGNKSFDLYEYVSTSRMLGDYLRTLLTNRDSNVDDGWLKTNRQTVSRILFGLTLLSEKLTDDLVDLEKFKLPQLFKHLKKLVNEKLEKPERNFYEFICDLPVGALVSEIQYHQFGARRNDITFGLVQFKLKIEYADRWLSLYSKTVVQRSYLEYAWSLSSGELAFLSYFSRLYSKFEEINRVPSLWLQIDESDLHLHPEWQRQFFKLFLNFLNTVFRKKQIQIFLATHSPIILSDVPKQHVIFLKRGANDLQQIVPKAVEGETFGGNIHQLFRQSFFLDNGFIGHFAEDKINGVIDDLNSQRQISKQRIDEIHTIIYSIGEPIIRNKLIQLYSDKFNLDADLRLRDLERKFDQFSRNKEQ